MKKEIIKTEGYLFIVDDSEIKEGDIYMRVDNGILFATLKNSNQEVVKKHCKKIIAHLPLDYSMIKGAKMPTFTSIPLLPSLGVEDDDCIEEMGEKYIKDEWGQDDDSVKFGIKVGYEKGYNKAKEKYKFTEEDMKKAYLKGATDCHDNCTERNWRGVEIKINIGELKELCINYIQSLSQPKMPTHIDIHMGTQYSEDGTSEEHMLLIDNKCGQRTIVGKYIYE